MLVNSPRTEVTDNKDQNRFWKHQRSAQAHTFTEADLQAYQTAWAQPGALTAMIGWYRSIWQSRRRAMEPDANRPLSMPTVILWGEQDQALGVELAEAPTVDTWVQWTGTLDVTPGDHTLRVRAIGRDGDVQTGAIADVVPDGATGWHTVDFRVRDA